MIYRHDRSPGFRPALFHGFLFLLVLSIGIFARTWEYRLLPPGLNADEASIGIEAYDVLHYGVDRNGIRYPVHFVSWGSGQNALYGYFLVPFIALLGLSPGVVRLPMLITGVASLPLAYWVGRQTVDARFGLLLMYFLAISPWHIMLSRWGLESNLFPFVFLVGYACLLRARYHSSWFTAAAVLFGLSLYAYGTAYAMVPVFVLISAIIADRYKLVDRQTLSKAAIALLVTAMPIAFLVAVNILDLPSITLGLITIPNLPTEARFEGVTILNTIKILPAIMGNLWSSVKLLILQSDGILYNVVEPYGYFYAISFPFSAFGIGLLVHQLKRNPRPEIYYLLAWIGASFVIAIFQTVNINRFNIIFIPLLVCAALTLTWLGARSRKVVPTAVAMLFAAFIGFTVAYHGETYRLQVDRKFNNGLLPALNFARSESDNPVCMTDNINMPYIFALFSEQTNPSAYLNTVSYVDAQAPLRQVRSFGRYTFGTENCTGGSPFTYVLRTDEIPPRLGNRYDYEFFEYFVVYYPKH